MRRMGLAPGVDGVWSKANNKEYRSARSEQLKAFALDLRRSASEFAGNPEHDGADPITARRLMFFDGKTRRLPLIKCLPRNFPASKNLKRPRDEWFDGTEPHHEYVVQLALSAYTGTYYPEAEYRVDAMGNGMGKIQGAKLKAVNKRKGWPDFELYEHSDKYCGLFLELKTYKTKLFKRNGGWSGEVDPKTGKAHLESQNECHIKMRERGWKGGFVKGIAQCIEAVDCYMNQDFDRFDEFIIEY